MAREYQFQCYCKELCVDPETGMVRTDDALKGEDTPDGCARSAASTGETDQSRYPS